MLAQAILDWFISQFPEFVDFWRSPNNCFREADDSFTRCGVFAEFSQYFRDHYDQFSPEQIAAIGRFVTQCAASTDEELAGAVAACFLENVADERLSADFRLHLSGEALSIYSRWDNTD